MSTQKASQILRQRGKLEAKGQEIRQAIRKANQMLARHLFTAKASLGIELKDLAKASKIKETSLVNYMYGNNIIPEQMAKRIIAGLNKLQERKQKQ